MNLPAMIPGNAAAKLKKAQAELATAEAMRADLQEKLAALDVESDDYPNAVNALTATIAVTQKSIDVLTRQIAGLEQKVAVEQAADRERRRQAAIKKVDTVIASICRGRGKPCGCTRGPACHKGFDDRGSQQNHQRMADRRYSDAVRRLFRGRSSRSRTAGLDGGR